MAQQLLHHPQIGASVEQVGGEGVAQGVRVGGAGGAVVEDPTINTRETLLERARSA